MARRWTRAVWWRLRSSTSSRLPSRLFAWSIVQPVGCRTISRRPKSLRSSLPSAGAYNQRLGPDVPDVRQGSIFTVGSAPATYHWPASRHRRRIRTFPTATKSPMRKSLQSFLRSTKQRSAALSDLRTIAASDGVRLAQARRRSTPLRFLRAERSVQLAPLGCARAWGVTAGL